MYLFIAFTFILVSVAVAQEIDCTLYQSQVDSATQQVNNAQKDLDKATASLLQCQSVLDVVKTR